jgi:hypothetical protein
VFYELLGASEGQQHLIWRGAASLRSQTRALEGDPESCFVGRPGAKILGECIDVGCDGRRVVWEAD